MGGILPYKWEAYCSTNGRCTVGFPFLQGLKARKVQRYKWGAYCRTNWGCTAVLSSRPVGLGFLRNSSDLVGKIAVTTTTKIFRKYCDTNGRRIAIQMGGVLQNKWEAYCDTNGRSTANIPFPQSVWGTRSTAIQIGRVLQHKLEVYRGTFLRSSGGWGF